MKPFHALQVILLLNSTSVQSQHRWSLSTLLSEDTMHRIAGLDYEASFGSNALNTSIVYGAVFKTDITRESMLNTTGKARAVNRAGYDGGATIWYRFKHTNGDTARSDRAETFSFLSVGNREHIDAQFSRDAIKLVALGNKQFAGKTADIGALQLQILRYTQLRYALLRKTSGYTAAVAVSALMGHQYFNASTQEARLYTSDLGDSLHALALGEMHRTDTAAKIYFDPNGLGFSVDLYFETQFDLLNGNSYKGNIGFEISDLGFIWWDKKSLRMEIDGQYAWAGFKFNDITQITDSLINSQRPSSIQEQLVAHNDKGSYTTTTLPRIAINYREQLSARWNLFLSLQHRLFANQLPMLDAMQSFVIQPSSPLKPTLLMHQSVGGYNWISVGAGFQLSPGHLLIKLGMRNMPAAFFPSGLAGFNAYLSVSGGR